MKSDPTFWIMARASGLSAYLLLTISILAGLTVKSRPLPKAVKTASVTDVHRFLALLGLGAIAVHGITLVLDRVVQVSLKALFVPGLVPYRPLWTGVGVVTAEAMLLVYVSFSVRKLIGVRNWRRPHYATYPIFAGPTVHGLMSGSDTGNRWVLDVYMGAVGAVVAATVWRILTASGAKGRPRVTAAKARPEAGSVTG